MRRVASVASMAWVAVALFGIVPARALEAPAREDRARAMARYDLNHDGVLSLAEKEAYRQDVRQRVASLRAATIKQYDANRNGTLEPDERLAMQQARAAQHARSEARALAQFDANHNGTLDPPEQELRRAKREAWIAEKRAQTLQHFDANGNGLLDESEKATMRQRVEDARAAALEAFDKNGDGKLDKHERETATEADLAKISADRTSARRGPMGAAVGGEVTSQGGAARLSIPPGALAKDVRVTVSPEERTGEFREGGRRVLRVFHVHWDGAALKKPATLAMSYGPVAATVLPANLIIGRWTGDAWQDVGGTLASADQRVSAPVIEPGRYGLIERVSAPATASAVSNLRVTPSSGRSYAMGADIRFTLASPGGVSVKLFDPAGRHVRSVTNRQSMNEGEQVVRWDGRNSVGRTMPSGLYLVIVEAPANKLTKKVMFVR